MANPYFNASYYLANNLDVLAAGYSVETAESHYLQFGAAEALSGTNTARKPAPWFDIQYYITSNPDLLANGITVDTAFQHFTTYGINEGRSPSNGINLTTAKLSAYATANTDLQTAFGITDPANLTDAQADALANHYYEFGYKEDRPASPADTDVNPGQTFTLTTATDVLTGTSGDDTFVGTDGTYTTGDSLKGGGGVDQVNLTLGATTAAIVSLEGIEKVKISDYAGATLNGANWSGVESIAFVGSTAGTIVQNLAAIPSVTVENNNVAATVTMTTAAVAGSSDSVTVNANGYGVTGTVPALTINGVETVNLNATGKGSVFTLSNNALKTLNVTGDQTVNVSGAALNSTTTKVDASAMTGGGLTVNVQGAAGLTNVSGGAGNDTFLFGTQAVGTTVVAGGAGADTIGVNAANVAALLATTSKVTGIETLRVQNAVDLTGNGAGTTYDLSKVAGLANIRFDGAVTAVSGAAEILTVDNLASGGLVTFGADVVQTTAGNAGLVLNVKDAASTANDTLSIKLTAGASTAANQAVAGLTAANVETISIDVANLKDAATGTTFTGIADSQLQVLNLTSSAKDATGAAVKADDITLGNGFTSTIVNTVDASGYNGAVDITALSGNLIASGATLKGGAEDFKVTGGAGADQIFTGAGGSTALTGGAGADTINLSASVAKADTVIVGTTDSQYTAFDSIIGFTNAVTNGDKLDLEGAAAVASAVAAGTATSVTNLTGQISSGILTFGGSAAETATLQQKLTAADDLVTATLQAAAFVHDGSTYVFQEVGGGSDLTAADVVVKLVGVTDLTSLSVTASGEGQLFIA